MTQDKYKGYDTSIIYDYKEYPDKQAGICDNCGNAQFKSSVKDYVFLRECRQCGMKKTIRPFSGSFLHIKSTP